MRAGILFLILVMNHSSLSFADEMAVTSLKDAVSATPCDENKVAAALKKAEPDEGLVSQGLINGCKSVTSAFSGFNRQQMLHVSQRVWKFWSGEFYPNAKQAPQAVDDERLTRTSYGLGVALGISEALCEKKVEGACALSAQLKPAVEKQVTEVSVLVKATHQSTDESRWDGPCGGDPECFKYQHKKMTQAITNPAGDWAGHDPYEYHLIQLVNGFAVFADPSKSDLIAIQQKSIHNLSHPTLSPGDNILGALGAGECTKFLSEGTEKSRDGFDEHVYRYKASPCH